MMNNTSLNIVRIKIILVYVLLECFVKFMTIQARDTSRVGEVTL